MLIPDKQHPIAYFCAEFALTDNLPIYAGGLGVLAGDFVKEAADQKLPLVAIGLFYHQGYFRQLISKDGQQSERYDQINPRSAGLTLVRDIAHAPIKIYIPYLFGQICAQVWKIMVGQVPVYLLDTDIPQNSPASRAITQRLYGGDRHTRMKQELVLGVGGAKLLQLLKLTPSIYHLNEGHSAFAVFEITRQSMHQNNLTFPQALHQVKHKLVFTNHTIVPAGNDLFLSEEVSRYLSAFATQANLPLDMLITLGTDKTNYFSMTTLALNTAAKANAVSQLHGHMAKTVWPDYTFAAVTNGVHMPTWVSPDIQKAVSGDLTEIGLAKLTPHSLWSIHQHQKETMLRFVKEQTGVAFNAQALTVVWARRFATYKRPALLLHQIGLLKELSQNGQRLQLIIAGKAHPHDQPAKELIEQVYQTIKDHHLEQSVVFVPNYHMESAKILVAGAEVWLNTPIRGQEASGTSGMKAGANGALLVSTNDGWMAEVNWKDTGWIIPDLHTDAHLYQLLQRHILPMYEDKTDQGLPAEWIWRMHQTMRICWKNFSATRMLNQYKDQMYQPLLDRE